jgi:Cysteine-rich CPCC
MTRGEAIERLVSDGLVRLARPIREQILLEWWLLDPADAEWLELPDDLRTELSGSSGPSDPHHRRYDPIVRIALRASFIGAINSFLADELARLGSSEAGVVEVIGEVEPLEACPICEHRTLAARGHYEICPVCFWEDDGGPAGPESERHSHANHMTPAKAHANWRQLGAVEAAALQHVLPDGRRRYAGPPVVS